MLLSDPKHQHHWNRRRILMLRDRPSMPRQPKSGLHQTNKAISVANVLFHQRDSLHDRFPLYKPPVLLKGGAARAAIKASKVAMVAGKLSRVGKAIAKASIGVAKLAGKGAFKAAKSMPTKKVGETLKNIKSGVGKGLKKLKKGYDDFGKIGQEAKIRDLATEITDFARQRQLTTVAKKKLSKFERFLLTDWDSWAAKKLSFGKAGWKGSPSPWKEPGKFLQKKFFQSFVSNMQKWRSVVPRLKAFFGDSDVYMKLYRTCVKSGKNIDDCMLLVGQLRPSSNAGVFSKGLFFKRMYNKSMNKLGNELGEKFYQGRRVKTFINGKISGNISLPSSSMDPNMIKISGLATKVIKSGAKAKFSGVQGRRLARMGRYTNADRMAEALDLVVGWPLMKMAKLAAFYGMASLVSGTDPFDPTDFFENYDVEFMKANVDPPIINYIRLSKRFRDKKSQRGKASFSERYWGRYRGSKARTNDGKVDLIGFRKHYTKNYNANYGPFNPRPSTGRGRAPKVTTRLMQLNTVNPAVRLTQGLIASTAATVSARELLENNGVPQQLRKWYEHEGRDTDSYGMTAKLYNEVARDVVLGCALLNNGEKDCSKVKDLLADNKSRSIFTRIVDDTKHKTSKDITVYGESCAYQKNRSPGDSHGAQPMCVGKHEKSYVYGGKEIPLFLSEVLTVQDPQGFVKYAFDAKPLPDARNRHVYKCVQGTLDSKPSGTHVFPSKWLDPGFQERQALFKKAYEGIARVIPHGKSGLNCNFSREDYSSGGGENLGCNMDLYEAESNPGNYGKWFYGYKKETMCDAELRLLTRMGRNPSLQHSADLTIFTDPTLADACYNDGTKQEGIQSYDECGKCVSASLQTANFSIQTSNLPTLKTDKFECMHYAALIGKPFATNENAPNDPAGCAIKPDQSKVYFNENKNGGSDAVKCGDNQYGLNCVEVDVQKEVSMSEHNDKYSCMGAKGIWYPFDWRQTPNVNEAMTCYDGCGGWCVSDDEKTELIQTKRCSASRKECSTDAQCACDNPLTEDNCLANAAHMYDQQVNTGGNTFGWTPEFVSGSWDDKPTGCSINTNDLKVYFNHTEGVGEKENYTIVEHPDPLCNQKCVGEIATCGDFAHSINVHRFCETTGMADSTLCKKSQQSTYVVPGSTLVRPTAGKKGHWDINGKCGLGFATQYDDKVDWCGPLGMTDLTDNLFTWPYNSYQTGKMLTCGQTLNPLTSGQASGVFNTKIVSQLCERRLEDDIKSNPFRFTEHYFPQKSCQTPTTKEVCQKYAHARGLNFSDRSSVEAGPHQCNAIVKKISEHSLGKTMSYNQAKDYCESSEGTRLAKPMEILDFMAYKSDKLKSWTPVFSSTENSWMQIGEHNDYPCLPIR